MQIKDIVFELARITEAASIATYKHIGRADKNAADADAVAAMRVMLNQINISGEIVNGEGSMDEAPLLYNGEKVGNGGIDVDIAVDPIDGTTMVAYGTYNSIAAIAVAQKGCMLKSPDMYMNKIVVGPKCRDVIDIRLSLTENLKNVAAALEKPVCDVGLAILDRERHLGFIKEAKELGVKIFLFDAGDITTAIQTCDKFSDIDIMYGIGGGPEGVLAAAAVKALGGNIQGQLVHYDVVWPSEIETERFLENEKKMLNELNLSIDDILLVDDLISGDDFAFSATGITKGDLLDGVVFDGDTYLTHTILVRAQTRTLRKIRSTHYAELKNVKLKNIINSNH